MKRIIHHNEIRNDENRTELELSKTELNSHILQKEPLTEMARVNIRDKGKLFPYNAFTVSIYSNEHNPPHMHIISKQEGYDIRISIATGDLVSVKAYGNRPDGDLFKDVVKKAKEWLNQPSKLPVNGTYQEVATIIWSCMNG